MVQKTITIQVDYATWKNAKQISLNKGLSLKDYIVQLIKNDEQKNAHKVNAT